MLKQQESEMLRRAMNVMGRTRGLERSVRRPHAPGKLHRLRQMGRPNDDVIREMPGANKISGLFKGFRTTHSWKAPWIATHKIRLSIILGEAVVFLSLQDITDLCLVTTFMIAHNDVKSTTNRRW